MGPRERPLWAFIMSLPGWSNTAGPLYTMELRRLQAHALLQLMWACMYTWERGMYLAQPRSLLDCSS